LESLKVLNFSPAGYDGGKGLTPSLPPRISAA
jgi:hypothetical protein